MLSFVEAGGWDGDYATWGVGSLEMDDSDEEILVDLNGNAAVDAKFDIDSGKKVRVWLNPPKKDGVYPGYQIVKIKQI